MTDRVATALEDLARSLATSAVVESRRTEEVVPRSIGATPRSTPSRGDIWRGRCMITLGARWYQCEWCGQPATHYPDRCPTPDLLSAAARRRR